MNRLKLNTQPKTKHLACDMASTARSAVILTAILLISTSPALPEQQAAAGGEASMTLRDLTQAAASCGPGALVQSNPLTGFKELQKIHHSWPIPEHYLQTSDPSFADGLMHDYVRISGACSLSLEALNQTLLNTCSEICDAVATARKGAPPSITVNYSPWYHMFPGKDPTVAGAPEVIFT